MKTLIIGTMAALSAVSCNNSSETTKKAEGDSLVPPTTAMANVLTEAQQKEGWQLLFDGQTTRGWHKYGGSAVGSAWKVADGTLYLDTTDKKDWQIKDGGDIVSDSAYDNFHLKLEWKIANFMSRFSHTTKIPFSRCENERLIYSSEIFTIY